MIIVGEYVCYFELQKERSNIFHDQCINRITDKVKRNAQCYRRARQRTEKKIVCTFHGNRWRLIGAWISIPRKKGRLQSSVQLDVERAGQRTRAYSRKRESGTRLNVSENKLPLPAQIISTRNHLHPCVKNNVFIKNSLKSLKNIFNNILYAVSNAFSVKVFFLQTINIEKYSSAKKMFCFIVCSARFFVINTAYVHEKTLRSISRVKRKTVILSFAD